MFSMFLAWLDMPGNPKPETHSPPAIPHSGHTPLTLPRKSYPHTPPRVASALTGLFSCPIGLVHDPWHCAPSAPCTSRRRRALTRPATSRTRPAFNAKRHCVLNQPPEEIQRGHDPDPAHNTEHGKRRIRKPAVPHFEADDRCAQGQSEEGPQRPFCSPAERSRPVGNQFQIAPPTEKPRLFGTDCAPLRVKRRAAPRHVSRRACVRIAPAVPEHADEAPHSGHASRSPLPRRLYPQFPQYRPFGPIVRRWFGGNAIAAAMMSGHMRPALTAVEPPR